VFEDYSTAEIVARIPDYFIPENAAGITSSIEFKLQGTDGGTWHMLIADQTCTVVDGGLESADLKLGAKASDILQLLSGKLNPMVALFTGKIRFEGDKNVAMKLATLFREPDFL